MIRSARSRCLGMAATAGLAALAIAMPTPAHAWWRGGVFVGVAPGPFVVAPPYAPWYAAPPAYWAPPPYPWAPGAQYYGAPRNPSAPGGQDYGGPQDYQTPPDYGFQPSPPLGGAPGAGQPVPGYGPGPAPSQAASCYAERYVCPLERAVPPGSACSCPSNRGGRVWGQAG